jgi:hypothetical protein
MLGIGRERTMQDEVNRAGEMGSTLSETIEEKKEVRDE